MLEELTAKTTLFMVQNSTYSWQHLIFVTFLGMLTVHTQIAQLLRSSMLPLKKKKSTTTKVLTSFATSQNPPAIISEVVPFTSISILYQSYRAWRNCCQFRGSFSHRTRFIPPSAPSLRNNLNTPTPQSTHGKHAPFASFAANIFTFYTPSTQHNVHA